MAIPRLYTGKGVAVEFPRPAITPQEISERHGRSLASILRYTGTLRQRRKESLLKLTDYDYNKKLLSTDRDEMLRILRGASERQATIMAGAGASYDLPIERIIEMKQIRESAEMEMGGIEERRGKISTALLKLQADQASGKALIYDQEASMEAIRAAEESREILPEGLLKTVPVNIKELVFQASENVRKIETDQYTSKDVGDSVIIIQGEAYSKKDIEIQAEILSGKSRAQKALFDEYGDVKGIAGAIEEMLPTLYGKKISVRKRKEEPDVDRISSKENIKITKGIPHKITGAVGTRGDKGSFNISESWSVNYKGKAPELRVDANSYIVQSGKKAEERGLYAGQTVAQANVDAADLTYEIERQEIQKRRVYEGETIKVVTEERKLIDLKQTINGGDPVSDEVWAKMSLDQQARSPMVPVVVSYLKDAVYGTFTIMDRLDSRMINELGLSPEFMKQITGEEKVRDSRGNVYDLNK